MNYLPIVTYIVSGGPGYKVACSIILLDLIPVLSSGPDPERLFRCSLPCANNSWLVQETLRWMDWPQMNESQS